MDKLISINILLICFFLGKPNALFSASQLTYPEELNEKFVLFTDRTCYGVNEIIYFKAFNNSHYLVKARNWSKVFYMELVNSEGTPAFKGKYTLSETGAAGGIIIPSDLPTDNYYLIGYTKWMRNFSPLGFTFVKLQIINPRKAYINENRSSEDSVFIQQIEIPIQKDVVRCTMPKSTYTKREQVYVKIKFPESSNALSHHYCISVVKKAAIDFEHFGIIHSGITVNSDSIANNFIPELNGITISGRIAGNYNSTPLSNTNISLSVLGNRFDYMQTETDTEGRFTFSLQPACKTNDMYISCRNANQSPIKILIDNEFFSETFSFHGFPLVFSDDEKQIAEEIMFNMQVNQTFNNSDMEYPCTDTNTSDFYGPPSKTIHIKDYIELPNLKEVFIELMPEVMILNKKGETYLQVKGRIENYPEFASNKPLILVDRIPVTDIEELLKISPTRISHIELVNEIYIKGDYKFGGIVSIFSNKGDLAGIRLPENSMFFNYDGFTTQPLVKVYTPENIEAHHPDYRNNLFWEPDLIAKPGTETQIEFYTADVTGNYIFLIRGLSEGGKIVSGSIDFQVK